MTIKKYLLLLFTIISLLSIDRSFAGDLIEIGEIEHFNYRSMEQEIKFNLKEINDIYGVNLDIVFLGKDKNNCYKERNYIKCIRDKEGLMSNYTWVINIGIKEDTGKGDVNSFMSKNVQEYRSIFNETNMKDFQKDVVKYLKQQDYLNPAVIFSEKTKEFLNKKCNTIKSNNVNINVQNCKLDTLYLKNKEITLKIKENDHKQELIDNKIKQEQLKETKILFKNIFSIVGIGSIIMFLIYYSINYIKGVIIYIKTKKLYRDIKDSKGFISINKKILEEDKDILIERIENLLDYIEKIFGNNKILKDDYKEILKRYKLIQDLEKEKIFSVKKMKKLNKNIQEIKNIDL